MRLPRINHCNYILPVCLRGSAVGAAVKSDGRTRRQHPLQTSQPFDSHFGFRVLLIFPAVNDFSDTYSARTETAEEWTDDCLKGKGCELREVGKFVFVLPLSWQR